MPRDSNNSLSYLQGRYWMLTLPWSCYVPYLPPGVRWCKGQLERGEGGYLHWQIVIATTEKLRGSRIKTLFGPEAHIELTRSAAANEYVWKEETKVAGTEFELGAKSLQRNSKTDWDTIRQRAISGDFDGIPSDVFVRCYHSLRQIRQDHLRPTALIRSCYVFWGRTGTGKSRRAWEEAGMEAYPKTPTTKFWNGYRGEKHVVIDEFRGNIEISHLLRWLDRYPVIVEVKGSSVVLRAERLWITSNIDPRNWYSQLDEETMDALLRRLEITHFDSLQ